MRAAPARLLPSRAALDLINLTLPAAWQWGAFGLLAPLLAWAASTAPWRRLGACEPMHLWLCTRGHAP